MDTILKNARLLDGSGIVDLGIKGGRIAAIEPHLEAAGEVVDLAGRLVSPGFIETHIHLDKSCILDRCKAERGDLDGLAREFTRGQRTSPEETPAVSASAAPGTRSPPGRH